MITTNTTYNNLIANGASYEWRVVNGSNTWTKEKLITGKLSSTLFERVSIGNAISSQLDLQLKDITVDQNSPLILQFRATANEGASVSTWYTKGTFYIDTVESSPYSEITKITAFDALIKSEIVYMRDGTWSPKTALLIMNGIAADIGIAVDSTTASYITANPITLTASPNIGVDGTTKREMLSYIAAMYGGNFRINAANKLELVRINVAATNTAQVGDAVRDFDASEAETVSKVRVWTNENTYYAAPGVPLLTEAGETILTESSEPILVAAEQFIEEWESLPGQVLDIRLDMYASAEMAERVYSIFSNLALQPFTCPFAFVDPKYEVGDGIAIKDITSVIGNMELDTTPLAPSKVDFGKTEVLNNKYKYQPSFERNTTYQLGLMPEKITSAVQNQTTLITGGFGGYIKFTYLDDGTPSEMLIMDSDSEDTAASIIRLNRNGIGFSTDGGQTYRNAWTIDGHLNADFITTGTLIADVLASHSISVSKLTGSIENGDWILDLDNGTLTIGDISANKITSGTLSADRLAANSIAVSKLTGSISNNNWVIDLTNGTLTLGNISADNINAGTMSANRISGGSIDASNVNITNLNASNIASGTLSANFISGGTINGNNVNVTNLKAGNIVSGTISDSSGKNYWNLDTGQFVTAQGTIAGFTISDSGLSVANPTMNEGYVNIDTNAITYTGRLRAHPQPVIQIMGQSIFFDIRPYNSSTGEFGSRETCGTISASADADGANKELSITGVLGGINLNSFGIELLGATTVSGALSLAQGGSVSYKRTTASLSYGGQSATVSIYRQLQTVTFLLALGNGTNFSGVGYNTTIMTLPVGLRPIQTQYIPGIVHSGAWDSGTYYPIIVHIGTDGTVKIKGNKSNIESTPYLHASCTFMTSAAMPE